MLVAGLIVAVLGVFLAIWVVRFTMGPLSDMQLIQKFDCERVTADVRETDVFCHNPKFYNDPTAVTYEEYYQEYGCSYILQSPPKDPTNAASYSAYQDCQDKTRLEVKRKAFIAEIVALKKKVDKVSWWPWG